MSQDDVLRVAEALAPMVEPEAGPLWERFHLSVWVRKSEAGTVLFDGWELTKSLTQPEDPPVPGDERPT